MISVWTVTISLVEMCFSESYSPDQLYIDLAVSWEFWISHHPNQEPSLTNTLSHLVGEAWANRGLNALV